ncbi:MAG: L-2-amino-thiazoline-4-carboxylic acid hydrolase [Methanosarcinales archaeon]|nr:L-2-amino-thiazoline-4-carboxylic acid hydrolase [Methanosarcinales archaeon]
MRPGEKSESITERDVAQALSDGQKADYFRRSYTAVDGLWFMKVGESHGFEEALNLDEQVWMVQPKIQSRMIRSMLQAGEGLEALFRCLAVRLSLEGFEFRAERGEDGIWVEVVRCPWHELMVKAGREALNNQVGERICQAENAVWASEFGPGIRFVREERICDGKARCLLRFSRD